MYIHHRTPLIAVNPLLSLPASSLPLPHASPLSPQGESVDVENPKIDSPRQTRSLDTLTLLCLLDTNCIRSEAWVSALVPPFFFSSCLSGVREICCGRLILYNLLPDRSFFRTTKHGHGLLIGNLITPLVPLTFPPSSHPPEHLDPSIESEETLRPSSLRRLSA